MIEVGAKHPPLSCRTSPPQGGNLAVPPGFANLQRWGFGEAAKLLISPLEGEMSGRTEGGVKERGFSGFLQHAVAP
ncbi:hypothetical protein X736_32075 [Mesorhizobium sp. L2C089B000]|nr:hypothetical protein X736_32075 [Mesorhizobium sp. L2C089B000]